MSAPVKGHAWQMTDWAPLSLPRSLHTLSTSHASATTWRRPHLSLWLISPLCTMDGKRSVDHRWGGRGEGGRTRRLFAQLIIGVCGGRHVRCFLSRFLVGTDFVYCSRTHGTPSGPFSLRPPLSFSVGPWRRPARKPVREALPFPSPFPSRKPTFFPNI